MFGFPLELASNPSVNRVIHGPPISPPAPIVAVTAFIPSIGSPSGSCVALTANRYSMSPAACRVATMPGWSHWKTGLMPALSRLRP